MADDDSSLMKAMIFVVVFSALFAFIFAYTSPMFSAGDPPSDDDWIQNTFDPEEIGTTTFWANDVGSTSGYNVTASITWNTQWIIGGIFSEGPSCDGSHLDFTTGGDDGINVYPMDHDINEYVSTDGMQPDSFVIYQDWGWWDKEYEVITYDNIINHLEVKEKNIMSKVHVDLKGGYNVWFIFPIGSDPETLLDNQGGYTIVIGQSLVEALESSQNIWNALTGIITFNIDTGYSLLDFLISLPIWICIAFITLTIVSKLIPGLG